MKTVNDPRYRVTPEAKRHLKEIARYTLREWGSVQRNKYLYAIEERMKWLASCPSGGRLRPDIFDGCYCFPQGRHVIYYLIQEQQIVIIGVLHKSMDVIAYFQEEP